MRRFVSIRLGPPEGFQPDEETSRVRSTVRAHGQESLVTMLRGSAERWPARPALIDGEHDCSYQRLSSLVLSFARRLVRERIFAEEKRAIVWMENSIEYVVSLFGILFAGGIAIVAPAAASASLVSEIAEYGAVTLILTRGFAEDTKEGFKPFSEDWIISDAMSEMHQFEDEPSLKEDANNDLAMVIFTSGTTARPRGVMLSHTGLALNARDICAGLTLTPTDSTIANLPFQHAFGNSVLQSHLMAGATVIIPSRGLTPFRLVEMIESVKPTCLYGTPPTFLSLLRTWNSRFEVLQQLRFVAVAGGRLVARDALDLANQIKPAELFIMYGQTEATARISILPPAYLSAKPDSVGRILPSLRGKITHDGGDATSNQAGELWVKGASLCLGYWRDSETTARIFAGEWLRTNDLARMDDDGFLYILGRNNRDVKIGGHRIDLEMLERRLQGELIDWSIAAVDFVSDDSITRLAIFAVPRIGATREEALRLKRLVPALLDKPSQPDILEVLTELPTTPASKIDFVRLQRFAQDSFRRKDSQML